MSETATTPPFVTAQDILGFPGAQLSGIKREREGQRIVWNANVCAKKAGKVWFGDIDLNVAGGKLRQLATELGETVYVLREHDARFANEKNPLWNEAVETYEASR